MATISGASSVSAATPASAPLPFPLEALPDDVYLVLFSQFTLPELGPLVLVNRKWKKEVIKAINLNIQAFSQLLAHGLSTDAFYEQKKLLTRISETAKIAKIATFGSLFDLSNYYWDAKGELSKVIATLDEPTTDILKISVQVPKLLGDVFEMAAAQRQLNEALVLRGPDILDLEKPLCILVKAGQFEQVLVSIMTISTSILRSQALHIICLLLLRLGKFEKAIMLVSSFPSKVDQKRALNYIARTLAGANKMVRAIDVINLNLEGSFRLAAFTNCCFYLLIDKRDYVGVLAFIKLVPSEKLRQKLYTELFKELFNDREHDRAIEVAKLFSDTNEQQEAFIRILACLAGDKDYVRTEEVTRLLPPEKERNFTCGTISKRLARDKKWREAREVVMLIPEGIQRDNVVTEISAILCAHALFDEAESFVCLFSNEELRAQGLTRVLCRKQDHRLAPKKSVI